jgi:hypothetical protein
MSDAKKQTAKPAINTTPPIVRHQYTDPLGIPRTVLLPKGETDVKAGIPVSLDLSPLFGHMPDTFQRELYAALAAQGLVEPADYFKKGAAERFRAAMFTVIKHDFLNVQTIAKEEL